MNFFVFFGYIVFMKLLLFLIFTTLCSQSWASVCNVQFDANDHAVSKENSLIIQKNIYEVESKVCPLVFEKYQLLTIKIDSSIKSKAEAHKARGIN